MWVDNSVPDNMAHSPEARATYIMDPSARAPWPQDALCEEVLGPGPLYIRGVTAQIATVSSGKATRGDTGAKAAMAFAKMAKWVLGDGALTQCRIL